MVSETIAIAAKARIKNDAINKSVVIDASCTLVWLFQESNSRAAPRFQPWNPLNAAPQSMGYNLLRPRMSPDIDLESDKRRDIGKMPLNPDSCVRRAPDS